MAHFSKKQQEFGKIRYLVGHPPLHGSHIPKSSLPRYICFCSRWPIGSFIRKTVTRSIIVGAEFTFSSSDHFSPLKKVYFFGLTTISTISIYKRITKMSTLEQFC